MSDDPETARQIEELAADDRPLLVLDVDDVVLEFVRPFPHFLKTRGFQLTLASFRLTGNIAETASGRLIEQAEVTALLGDFFDAQVDWQGITDGAAEALATLGRRAEIVLLTAMPHRHRAVRRAHLDALGLNYPLLTTEMAKGPAIAKLRGGQGQARRLCRRSALQPAVGAQRGRRCAPLPPDGRQCAARLPAADAGRHRRRRELA